MISSFSELVLELSRRRVVRATAAYALVLWLLAQGAAGLFPAFGFPDWALSALVGFGFAGLPVVVVLAWFYELTPSGLVRDPRSEPGLQGDAIEVSWTGRDGEQKSARFNKPFTIGRDEENDIRIDDRRVSRVYARVEQRDGQWWILDHASTNGTFINAQRQSEYLLDGSARVRLHRQGPMLEFHAAPDPTATTFVSFADRRTG